MQKRDYLMDEIHRIGKIISDYLSAYRQSPTPENFEQTNGAFLEEIQLNIEDLVGKKDEEINLFFKTSNYTFEQQENIAEYLFLASENTSSKEKYTKYLQTAKIILESINVNSESVSFARMDLEKEINQALLK